MRLVQSSVACMENLHGRMPAGYTLYSFNLVPRLSVVLPYSNHVEPLDYVNKSILPAASCVLCVLSWLFAKLCNFSLIDS